MQRDAHDAVGGVEGLLDARRVHRVHVDEEHTLDALQQRQHGQHHVIDIREARRAVTPRVRLPPAPVDGDVRLAGGEELGGVHGCARVDLRVRPGRLAEADRVVEHVVCSLIGHLLAVQLNLLEKGDVRVRVVAADRRGRRWRPAVAAAPHHGHVLVQPAVDDQIVGQPDGVRLAQRRLWRRVHPNVVVQEVGDPSFCCKGGLLRLRRCGCA
mmetsp:Transcript_35983/g.119152  ORF Transcript_35983/g.119152 Transcript_35983/m.119152 type:complete len:212 (+) Transcript_35983:703-1338(+)